MRCQNLSLFLNLALRILDTGRIKFFTTFIKWSYQKPKEKLALRGQSMLLQIMFQKHPKASLHQYIYSRAIHYICSDLVYVFSLSSSFNSL